MLLDVFLYTMSMLLDEFFYTSYVIQIIFKNLSICLVIVAGKSKVLTWKVGKADVFCFLRRS